MNRYLKYLQFIKSPQLFFRIISNHMQIVFAKKQKLIAVDLAITYSCPASCPKCFAKKMDNKNSVELTISEWKRVVNECLDLGAIIFDITGGEPLSDPKIFDFIRAINTQKALISVFTNGFKLDPETIIKLRDYGVSLVKISLDSPYPDEHDQLCGLKGCFERIMTALKVFQKTKGIQGHLSTLATSKLLNDKERLERLKEIARKFGVTIGFTLPSPAGNWSENPEIMLKDADFKILEELKKIPYITTCTDAAYFKPHCRAGIEQLHITCYGDVLPCPLIQISFGNIKEKKLSEIYKNILKFPPFLNPSNVCLTSHDKCFYDQYLKALNNYKQTPVDISELPKAI